MGGERDRGRPGFSFTETVVVLAILGMAGGAAVAVYGELAGSRGLAAAVRVVRGDLQHARLAAVARREVVRIRLRRGAMILYDSRDQELRRRSLADGALAGLDSIRLRPGTLRFNARGQAGPGSVYLHRGRRSVRVVINFLGRMREEWSVRP